MELKGRLPQALPGWQTNELPLGPNELLTERATEILRFDEYVYREYSRASQGFAVYSAYWSPGKMPTRLIALHTPDRCWTENGWICQEQQFGVLVGQSGNMLYPAQWRVFTPPGQNNRQYVLFWLLVDGKPYNFGHRLNTIPHPLKWWSDVIDEAVAGSKEHLFVRITSSRPFEELAGDPGWEQLLVALGKLGLGEAPKAPRPET